MTSPKPRLRITVEVLDFPAHQRDLGVRVDMRDVGRIATRDTWLNPFTSRFSVDVQSADVRVRIGPDAAYIPPGEDS